MISVLEGEQSEMTERLVALTLLAQYVTKAGGIAKIERFVEIDRAHKDNEISRMTSRSINEAEPVNAERETALAEIAVFQVQHNVVYPGEE